MTQRKMLYADTNGFYSESALVYESADHINSSAGAGDAGKPIVLDAAGNIDATMINDADIDHGGIGGLTDIADHPGYIELGGTRAFTGAQSMGSNKLTSLSDGTLTNDAVNLGQLNAAFNNLDRKDSVRIVATSNVALTGEQTIDGILSSTDRILLVGQTAGAENGIYVTAAGAWARSTDADSNAEVTSGFMTTIEEGAIGAGRMYLLSTADSIVLDTTALTFIDVSPQVVTASLGVIRVGDDFRSDLLAGGGIKLTGNEIGVEPNDFAGLGMVDDGSDNLAIDFSTAFNDSKAVKASQLNSVVNGEGASIIGVEDSAGNFTGTDIEAVLAELAQDSITYTVGTGGVTKGDVVYVSGNDTILPYGTLTNPEVAIGMAASTQSAAASVSVLGNDTVATGILTAATAGTIYWWDGSALSATIPTGAGKHIWNAGVAKNATDLHVQVAFFRVNS